MLKISHNKKKLKKIIYIYFLGAIKLHLILGNNFAPLPVLLIGKFGGHA